MRLMAQALRKAWVSSDPTQGRGLSLLHLLPRSGEGAKSREVKVTGPWWQSKGAAEAGPTSESGQWVLLSSLIR